MQISRLGLRELSNFLMKSSFFCFKHYNIFRPDSISNAVKKSAFDLIDHHDSNTRDKMLLSQGEILLSDIFTKEGVLKDQWSSYLYASISTDFSCMLIVSKKHKVLSLLSQFKSLENESPAMDIASTNLGQNSQLI